MELLGNVENGWFAQLAHGCQALSQGTLNLVSCGNQWGDKFYGQMENAANQYVAGVNEHAIQKAITEGATQHQALSAGTAALEKVAQPANVGELLNLAGAGVKVSADTVGSSAKEVFNAANPPASFEALTPLLAGLGILGGAYVVTNLCCNGPAPSKGKRRVMAMR